MLRLEVLTMSDADNSEEVGTWSQDHEAGSCRWMQGFSIFL